MTELNQARGATKSLLEELRNYRATERKLTVLKDMAVQFEKEADKTIGMVGKAWMNENWIHELANRKLQKKTRENSSKLFSLSSDK